MSSQEQLTSGAVRLCSRRGHAQVMVPIVKLLRLCDGEKPAMGKIYDRMFMIGQKISESKVSWKTVSRTRARYRPAVSRQIFVCTLLSTLHCYGLGRP